MPDVAEDPLRVVARRPQALRDVVRGEPRHALDGARAEAVQVQSEAQSPFLQTGR